MKRCGICNRPIEREDAPVIAMGGFGNARYLCDECDALIESATRGTEYSEIAAAMDKISGKMAEGNPDGIVYNTVSSLMASAAARAKAIERGEYDFSLDEQAPEGEEGFDEIPEELAETEEDKEKDRRDEEEQKKFDKVYNYILAGACIGVALFIIWKLIDTFLLK